MLVASLQTPRAEEVEAKQQQQLGCLMSGSRQIKLNLRRAEEIRTLDFEVEFKILGFRINMILGLGGRLASPPLSHRQLSPRWTKLPGAGTLC